MKIQLSYSFFLLLFFVSCVGSIDEPIISIQEGLRPVYTDPTTAREINNLPPRSIQQLGKIYYKDQHIFVIEVGEGIHIIDNSDPMNPNFINFIQVIGSKDIAIKGNYLYTDNLTDLVVLDISDLRNTKLVKRVPELYAQIDPFPAGYQGPFECVNQELVAVIRWEMATLNDPKCFR